MPFSSRDVKRFPLSQKMGIVVCAPDLADRDRNAFLTETFQMHATPKLILSERGSERLWWEELRLGRYDVLAWPYEGAEVRRVVNLASNLWNRDRENPLPQLKPSVSEFLTDKPYQKRAGSVC